MSAENVEAIRQRIVSLVVDSQNLRRKIDRACRAPSQRKGITSNAEQEADANFAALKDIADRIDRETRELFHLLPEHLRPTEMPRPQAPRQSCRDGSERHQKFHPSPGGPIPREILWPAWTIEKILTLVDEYKVKHGEWPNRNSGRISDVSPDTWCGIDIALKKGNRGLSGGSSLAKLLSEHRNVRTSADLPRLSIEQVLAWADSHYARVGKWPTVHSGPVTEAPNETWLAINHALIKGSRGLPKMASLARLLYDRRGVLDHINQPPLTVEQILSWADAHHSRTGKWPTSESGGIPEAPMEDWRRVNWALTQGNRSLAGGASLARLLAEHRGVRNRKALPHFEVEKILVWADLHRQRTGRWPTVWSGRIVDEPNESWTAVDSAFKIGTRGLAGSPYRSLSHLLDMRRRNIP